MTGTPLPRDLVLLVPAIARNWRVSVKAELHSAFHDRMRELKTGAGELKLVLIEAGLRVAWAERKSPWLPRRDSLESPMVPSRDLSADQFRRWLKREAMKAAEHDLLDLPYPSVSEPTRTILDVGPAELDGGEDDSGRNSLIDTEYDALLEEAGWVDDEDAWEKRRSQWRKRLRELRRRLPEGQRRVLDAKLLLLKQGKRATSAEVARQLGLAESTVRVQEFRMKNSLRM